MKKISRFLCLWAMVWLVAILPLLARAADTEYLIIDGATIDKISISGDNDGISISSNSYKITAKDASKSQICGGTKYNAQTRTLTFTNNYEGWVKITYTIDDNGTLANKSNCSIENGVITMQSGGTFTIAVKSSSNSGASTQASKTCEFKPTAIEYEEFTPLINFVKPEHGTFTIKDGAGTVVTVPGSAESSSYTLTAVPDSGYQICRWVFTDSSGVKTYFGTKTTTVPYAAFTEGSITCEFMPTGSALYTVDSVPYGYLDQAVAAAQNSSTKQIVLTETGSVYDSTGSNKVTIPNGVTLVLPYASGATTVQNSSDYFPYGNYTNAALSNGNWYPNPQSPSSNKYLELTIPSGTTVVNNGIISVGGTQAGNAATYGSHSNLIVNGTLEVNTGVLSVCGYVTGSGSIVANGNDAKIYQPMVLLRIDCHGWITGLTGSMKSSTVPEGVSNQNNPSPRYVTQNIQCRLEMKSGDSLYGYLCQVNSSKFYRASTMLIGTYNSSNNNILIGLHNGATLVSTYNGSNTSSSYSTIGKQTLTITGGATQGNLTANVGTTLDLSKWPFPVPYNYDVILHNGTYTMNYDTSFLPGAGLKVGKEATLNINKSLAVMTGAYDHSVLPPKKDGETPSAIVNEDGTATFVGLYGSYGAGACRYPRASTLAKVSTLNGVSSGSKMGNFIVDGTLNINGSFGGIVQTTGTGVINMNSSTASITRQFGMTGISNSSPDYAHGGATVYTLEPQIFGTDGVLLTMQNGTTYRAANSNANSIASIEYVLYPNSGDTSAKQTCTETINATAVGQWTSNIATVTFDANGGSGEMAAQTVPTNEPAELNANTFTAPEGKVFKGWNTVQEPTEENPGESYEDCAEIVATGDITLYAQWWSCDHTAVTKVEEKPVTCEEAGTKAYWQCKSEECGKYFSDELYTTEIPDLDAWLADETGGLIPALGHITTAEDKDHICDRENCGTQISTCKEKAVATEAKDATCMAAGNIAYWTCGICRKHYSDADCTAEVTEVTIAINPDAHADSDKDHICENGCDVAQGEHKDTDNDGDHICDYCINGDVLTQCTAAEEWSSDATKHWHDCTECGADSDVETHADGDKNHKCDTCSYEMSQCSFTIEGDVKTAGDCMNETIYKAKCSVCGVVSETETIVGEKDSSKHTGNNHTENGAEATCTKDGYTGDTVCECGKTVTTGSIISAHGHNYGAAAYTWTEDGKKCTAKRTCTNDASHVEEKTVEAKGEVTIQPTCTVLGTTTYTATFDVEWAAEQTTTKQDVAVISHTYDQQNTADTYKKSDANCTDAAVYYYSCSCGAKGTETFNCGAAKGHTEVIDKAVEPDCTNTGLTEGKHCSVCGEVLTAQTVVDALGHTEVIDAAVEATCTATGLTEGKHCSVCNKILVAQTEVSKLDHEWVDADCNTPRTCSICKGTEGEPQGHSYKSVVTAPTFEAQGYTTHTCSNCGDSYKDSYVDALIAVAQVDNERFETLSAAVKAAQANDTVTLLTDTTLTERLTISTPLTLNLNGKTVTADFTDDFGAIYIGTQGDLTVTGNGTIVSKQDIVFANYGKITIENGTFRSEAGEDGYNAALYNMYYNGSTYGTAVIKGGTFESEVWNSGVLTVENGTLYGIDNSGKLDISGGTVNGMIIAGDGSDAPELANKGAISITGGSFENAVADEWCAEGYGPNKEAADNYYGVHKHVEVVDKAIAATCEGTGLTEGKHCSVCNEVLVAQTEVPALGHKMTHHDAVAPDCINDGTVEYWSCSVCNKNFSDKEGSEELTSIVDGKLDHEFAQTLSHDENDHWYACTRTGCTEKSGEKDHVWDNACDTDCNDGCGYTRTITHNYSVASDEVVTEANCVTKAVYKAECAVCGDVSDTKTIEGTTDATKHIGESDVRDAKDATCVDEGYTGDTYCSSCDKKIADGNSIAKLTTHTYPDTWTQTKAPTCTEKGREYRKCTVEGCESTEERDIDMADHTMSHTDEKDATCAASGNYEYWYCSVCTGYFKDDQGNEAYAENAWVIEMTDHVFETTYTTDGENHWFKCTNSECDVVDGKAAHSYANPQWNWTGNDADGYTAATATFKCTCGDEQPVDAKVSEQVTVEPTATTEGTKVYTANVTFEGKEYTAQEEVTIPATGVPEEPFVPNIAVTNPANGTSISYDIDVIESGGWTLTLTAADSAKPYVYLVKYTDAGGNESEKIANANSKYSDGSFVIPEDAVSVTVESALLGDVTGDGVLDSFDAAAVLRIGAGLEEGGELQLLAAETVADGAMDSFDAAKILRVSAGLDSGF